MNPANTEPDSEPFTLEAALAQARCAYCRPADNGCDCFLCRRDLEAMLEWGGNNELEAVYYRAEYDRLNGQVKAMAALLRSVADRFDPPTDEPTSDLEPVEG